MTIIDLMDDLFASWFKGDSWFAWRVCLKVTFGLPLGEAELRVYQGATGRTVPPTLAAAIAWYCIGRRGGKSLIGALIVVFLACFRDYSEFTVAGEVVTIMLVAADRKQARTVLRYIKAFLFQTPMLKRLVIRETRESIELSNGVSIEVHTASFRSVRGYTLGGVINDEICWWAGTVEESAEPDKDILAAQRPALTTIPGALMLNISSPYARRGSMYSAFEAHYGREDSSTLFWKAPSRSLQPNALVEMNPVLDVDLVRQAYEDDSIAAASEFGGEFRSDCERVFNLEKLEACTDYDRPLILPPCFEFEEENA